MAGAAWSTLGRYLLGAAALGLVESIIMGTTLVLVGADVVLPVVALTFAAAFFPFVGAIVAGLAATAVTLVAGGPQAAAIVAGVALLIQQFDNELLAPVIYSRALPHAPAGGDRLRRDRCRARRVGRSGDRGSARRCRAELVRGGPATPGRRRPPAES